MKEVYIAGHRGMGVTEKPRDEYLSHAKFYPENSLAAFRKALEEKEGNPGVAADVIEFDIHISKDGEAIVIHGTDLLNPYADYVGPHNGDISSHLLFNEPKKNHKPKVYDYTAEELQRDFTLKAHNISIQETGKFFDKLDIKSKSSLSDKIKEEILEQKKQLLNTDKEMHCIPTFTDLLNLMLEINGQRNIEGKSLAKMNIELKGEGSAIAAIASIIQFYKDHPGANEIVRPEDMIFLGRGEIGEIVIANALLKGDFKINSVVDEIKKYKTEEFIAERSVTGELRKSLEEKYQKECDVKERRDNRQSNSNPRVIKGEHTAKIVKKEKSAEAIERNAARLNSLVSLDEFIKYKADEEFSKPKLKQNILKQMYSNATKLLPENNEATAAYIASDVITIDDINIMNAININTGNKIGHAKTNFMLSTGQLFGNDNILPNGNFDLNPEVKNISEDGKIKIKDVLSRGYNGIDISLYDYCFGVIDVIEDAIQEQKIDKESLVLGASATNWKASKLENSPIKPMSAILIARSVVENSGISLLLKVDEPRVFKAFLNRVEEFYNRQDISFGETNVIVSDGPYVSEKEDNKIIYAQEEKENELDCSHISHISIAPDDVHYVDISNPLNLDGNSEGKDSSFGDIEFDLSKSEQSNENDVNIEAVTNNQLYQTPLKRAGILANDMSVSRVDERSLAENECRDLLATPTPYRPKRQADPIVTKNVISPSGKIIGYEYFININIGDRSALILVHNSFFSDDSMHATDNAANKAIALDIFANMFAENRTGEKAIGFTEDSFTGRLLAGEAKNTSLSVSVS